MRLLALLLLSSPFTLTAECCPVETDPGDATATEAPTSGADATAGGTGDVCEAIACGVVDPACELLDLPDCPLLETCADDPCAACGQAVGLCDHEEAPCPGVRDGCAVMRETCDCGACMPIADQTPDQRLALCLEHPWALGEDCKDPSVGQCFAAVGQALCAATTCEYIACMVAVAADPCGPTPPACSAAVLACTESDTP